MEFYTSQSKTIISSVDNSTLATLSSVGTYDEIHVCTFIEFSKMIRINTSGTMYGVIQQKYNTTLATAIWKTKFVM